MYAGQSVTFSASGGNRLRLGRKRLRQRKFAHRHVSHARHVHRYGLCLCKQPDAQSNIATASITVNPAGQMVAISPQTPSVAAGGNIQFTASGGQNGYVWGGAATGTGSTNTVTFPNVGTYSVTVYSPAGGVYAQSNTAVATVTVTLAGQMVAIAPTNPSVSAGGSITFAASGGQGLCLGRSRQRRRRLKDRHLSRLGLLQCDCLFAGGRQLTARATPRSRR